MPSTTTTPAGMPTSAEFNGDEFSNNLFSDLAPLLTLFGEQVTKQFLSLSMGWADNILLAMGPLGIITVVVSAIRVGGVKRLKALVGRARESSATAEAELLSSTSDNVCELWSGNEIVRAIGQPDRMQEWIILRKEIGENEQHVDKNLCVLNLKQASALDILRGKPQEITSEELERLAGQAPNITLNVRGSTSSRTELWFCVTIGVVLQIAAIVVPGFTVYLWKWQKGGNDVAAYGYPFFIAGSISVVLGLIGCSHVIEASTIEKEFHVSDPPLNLIRGIIQLQRACTVGEQKFSSFAILNGDKDLVLRTSRLGSRSYLSLLAASSTFITITGFIAQFVGLRALHWSATITQLFVTLAMTGVRAWVRRGLAEDPECIPVPENLETAWLALFASTPEDAKDEDPQDTSRTARNENENVVPPHEPLSCEHSDCRRSGCKRLLGLELYTGSLSNSALETEIEQPRIQNMDYKPNVAVQHHMSLQKTIDRPSDISAWSTRLCIAVERIMNYLQASEDVELKGHGAKQDTYLNWTVSAVRTRLDSQTNQDSPIIRPLTAGLVYKEASNVWKTDPDEVNSIIALWTCTLAQRMMRNRDNRQGPGPMDLEDSYSHDFILGCVNPDGHDSEHLISKWLYPKKLSKPPIAISYTKRSSCGGYGMYMRNRWLSRRQMRAEQEAQVLVVRMKTTVHQACALELLSFYMSAIASQVSLIGGTTNRHDYFTRIGWSNTVVNSISSFIVDVGLVRTIHEANTIVIPALFEYNILPEKASVPYYVSPEPTPSLSDMGYHNFCHGPYASLFGTTSHDSIEGQNPVALQSAMEEDLIEGTGDHALDQAGASMEDTHDDSVQQQQGNDAATIEHMDVEPKGKEKQRRSDSEAENGQAEETFEVSEDQSPLREIYEHNRKDKLIELKELQKHIQKRA